MVRQFTEIAQGDYGPIEGFPHDRVVFGHYRRTGTWSPELVARLGGWLSGGGTLLDVGANIGLVSVAVGQRTNATGMCFEPARENLTVLRRNLLRHALQERFEVHGVALHSTTGHARLSLDPTNSGDHHLIASEQAACERPNEERVPTRMLDDVLSDRALPGPVVMKVDTQGAEVHVLRGARRTLDRVDQLVIEYWPLGLWRLGHRPFDLRAELLQHFRYGALLDQQGGDARLQPAEELLERLAFFRDDDPGFFDLWLTKRMT